MNKQNYTSPSLGIEEFAMENGIAVSTIGMQQDMINEIWLTEEEMTWDE